MDKLSMQYGAMIKSAWQATWRYRAMWLLGMAVIGGCHSANLVNLPLDQLDNSQHSTDYQTQFIYDNLWSVAQEYWIFLTLIAACLVLLVITSYVCHYIAIGGMYQGASWAKQQQPVRFSALCKAGTQFFWPVVGVSLLISFASSLVLIVWVTVMIVSALTIVGLVVAIPLFLLLIVSALPLGWFLFTLRSLSIQGIVLQRLTVKAALQRAWQFWRNHLKDTALIYGATLLWNGATGLVFLFLLGLLAIPLVIFGYFAYSSQAWLALGLISLLGMTLILIIGLILKGINQSFITHLWHRVYAEIA